MIVALILMLSAANIYNIFDNQTKKAKKNAGTGTFLLFFG